MLDENPKFGLKAPNIDDPKTIWFNILVPDIKETYSKAIGLGCTEVQPVTEMPDYGVSNATFNDPYGYHWMLHQVHKEVSFKEREQLWEEKKEN
jgi:PhnB protein